jgi:hypothetical protein
MDAMKCFVCGKSNIESMYKPFLSSRNVNICSQECYHIYCSEYAMTELNVTITQMEKRLEKFKTKKREEQNQK